MAETPRSFFLRMVVRLRRKVRNLEAEVLRLKKREELLLRAVDESKRQVEKVLEASMEVREEC